MNLVIDASVAIKWFVREIQHENAHHLLREGYIFHAPDLIVTEVTNIAWKKTLRSEIEQGQAIAIARGITQAVPHLHPSSKLNERALQIALALRHPVYDCFYIACAEALDAVLVTADVRLREATHEFEFARYVYDLAGPFEIGP